jgi:hypothetical protein
MPTLLQAVFVMLFAVPSVPRRAKKHAKNSLPKDKVT